MSDIELLVALANARAPRRPTGARAPSPTDALADRRTATALLRPFLDRPIRPRELRALRELHQAVYGIVNALVDGSRVPVDALNQLSKAHPVTQLLEQIRGGELLITLRPSQPSACATLLTHAIAGLQTLEPSRLRRCARPECGLVFYDSTRPGTRRWHNERPCGLRERQRRYRAKRSSPAWG
jgi:predicted RNA-binding Zn ribbon-like protein